MNHLADKCFAIEPGRIDGKRVAGFHPERRRVDDEIVAGGVVPADFDPERRIMLAESSGEALHRRGMGVEEHYRAGALSGD
jgi:hypothetical protein